ncbi:MAG: SH3 domain-containing protein [Treponema sp.]|nr:SH3 domain-containing protein [Treponema sp.]
MEKQRRNSAEKSCRRLLICPNGFLIKRAFTFLFSLFLIYSLHPLFAADSAAGSAYFAVSQDVKNSRAFTNEELKFTLTIPEVTSSHVVYNFSYLKADYQKNENSEKKKIQIPFEIYKKFDSLNSTKIEFYIIFRDEGIYTFEPSTFFIDGKKNEFRIEKIQARKNPEVLNARLVIEFYDKGEKTKVLYSDSNISEFSEPAFEDLYFTVGIQYAREYSNFVYEIPDDSLFEQIKVYDNRSVNEADNRIIKIADFKWKALSHKKISFPKLSITARNNNNSTVELSFPRFTVDFSEAVKSSSGARFQGENEGITQNLDSEVLKYLDNAFEDIDDDEHKFSKEECNEIAEKLRAEKIDFKPAFIIFLILFLISIIAQIFLRKKYFRIKIFLIILSLIFLCTTVLFKIHGSEQSGIFYGGVVYSVPDDKSSVLIEIENGKKIQILQSGENWCKIRYENIEGWIPSGEFVRI